MKKALRFVDSLSESMAWALRFLCYALVLVVCFDVTMRYVFNAPTEWAYETALMLGATIYALAWTYTQRHNAHMRVDIIYAHLSPRSKAIIDICGTLLVFFPLIAMLISVSFERAWHSWEVNEKSIETSWYPPLAPVRTIVFLGFCLLAFQTVVLFIRNLHLAIRNKQYD
jgi:TRAP-type mannitol/chloroaromatic compound transport system permease small subunit